jgi:hypothetical protein
MLPLLALHLTAKDTVAVLPERSVTLWGFSP